MFIKLTKVVRDHDGVVTTSPIVFRVQNISCLEPVMQQLGDGESNDGTIIRLVGVTGFYTVIEPLSAIMEMIILR